MQPLDAAEQQVARARRQVHELILKLADQPIDAETYRQLRAYLDTEAAPALAALQALRERGPQQLRARIVELLAEVESDSRNAVLTSDGEDGAADGRAQQTA
ncbi:MAG TPA: hypothetical protein VKE25_13290 [Actinomycetes bacterium]|nr:hypothetical protein [Actinomycetes bacterium]